jgi:hypothetical protein
VSAETKAALDHAVAVHFADEQDGAILTGYVLQAKGQGFSAEDSNRTRMLRAIADGQDYITTLGLVDWMRIVAQRTALED